LSDNLPTYDNEPFGLTDDEYQILLEDIDQAAEEGNRKYGYGGRDVESEFQFQAKPKPTSKSRSKLRPQIYYNRVRRKQHQQQPMIKEFR
jgi:hypothetical protein